MSKIDTYTHTHLHTSAGSFLDGVGKCEEYMRPKSSRNGATSDLHTSASLSTVASHLCMSSRVKAINTESKLYLGMKCIVLKIDFVKV